MNRRMQRMVIAGAAVFWLATAPTAQAQPAMPDFDALIAEQRAAMAQLAWLDGTWRGTVSTFGPEGAVELVQTERVGTMAGGTVRMIDGRGYEDDGSLAFNAVALLTYDAFADKFLMTTSARGMTAKPWFKPTADGFEWGIDTGDRHISYIARHADGVWTEEGFMAQGAGSKTKFLTMRLERLGATPWPDAGAVGRQ